MAEIISERELKTRHRVINGKVCWMQGQFTQLFSVAVDPLV